MLIKSIMKDPHISIQSTLGTKPPAKVKKLLHRLVTMKDFLSRTKDLNTLRHITMSFYTENIRELEARHREFEQTIQKALELEQRMHNQYIKCFNQWRADSRWLNRSRSTTCNETIL